MLDKHGNIIVNDDGSMKGLEFLVGLEHDSKVQVMPTNVNFINGPPGPVISDFANGKTAMIFGGPYNVPDILAGRSFKSHPGNLGIARIPRCPAPTATCRAGQPGSPSGGQSYVISAHTAHPVEAYKFIAFMSSERSQIAIAKENRTLPTLNDAYQDKAVKHITFISEFCGIAYTAIARPAIPQSGHLFDVFDPHIAAALAGVESPPVALKAVADAWKQLLPSTAVTPSGVSPVECRTSS